MTSEVASRYVRAAAGACLLALGLGAILAGAMWTSAYHEWIGRFSDSISYLLLADYYSAVSLGRYPEGIERFYQTTRFPPLFSLMLAAGGGGTGRVQTAAVVTQIMVGLSAGAVATYLIQSTRDLLQGALLLVATAVCAGPFIVALDIVSEPLFACLVYGALAAAPKRLHRSVVPVLFSLAPLARTIGVCAAPALALWYWRSSPPGKRWRRILIAAATLVPTLFWFLYRRSSHSPDSYYAELIKGEGGLTLDGWVRFLALQPVRMFQGFVSSFDPSGGAIASFFVGAMLVAAAIGVVARCRRNELDVQVGASYLALVFMWPYPVELPRMLTVLVPMILLCAWEGWRVSFSSRFGPAAVPVRALLPALLALLLPLVAVAETSSLIVRRALTPEPADLRPYMRTAGYLLERDDARAHAQLEIEARVRYSIESLPQYVPAGECVYSLSPMRTWVYGRRYSKRMPTVFHAGQDARAQFQYCRYVLITLESTRQANEPVYFPIQHVGAITTPVFVSRFSYQNQDITAAVLLRFKD